MRTRLAQLAAALVLFVAAAPVPQKAARQKAAPAPHKTVARKPPALPCGDLLSFQVLLDQQGFSSGEIDGRAGPNFQRALAAMQAARSLPATGQADCDSWSALGGDKAGETIAEYALSEDDLKGPFEPNIPRELAKQATLTALAYRTPLERLAEKFHASPALLQRLNGGAPLAAGTTIKVPAVQAFDQGVKPAADPAREDVTIVVSRDDSALRVERADNSLVFFAPVTTGSEHDPLPVGDWKVRGVQWQPKFHYNPDLFWDSAPKDTKAMIPAGPNNPVGVVWIDLNLDHYGLHGTPEPGQVGHTASHGCVRLTNWDAARVAALVKPGTPVRFQ